MRWTTQNGHGCLKRYHLFGHCLATHRKSPAPPEGEAIQTVGEEGRPDWGRCSWILGAANLGPISMRNWEEDADLGGADQGPEEVGLMTLARVAVVARENGSP